MRRPLGGSWLAAWRFLASLSVYAWPSATLHGGGLHDLVAFFDSMNALAHGRTPSLDFHTSLGPADSAAMRDAHQEYLTRRFRLAAKSADWRLYEKSSPPKT